MTRKGKLSVLGALVACLVVAGLAGAAQQTRASSSAAAVTGCQLGDKGKIKHVIYVQFDNVHFLRDNPNVPSDIEQMPHLLNFIKDNGTLDTNDHTVLISHTGGGILSSLTGLYPDRHGQAVSNSYGFFRPDGTSGLLVDVQVLDRHAPTAATRRTVRRPRPRTRTSTWSTPTRRRSAAPAAARNAPGAVGARTRAPAATSATSASRTPCSRTTTRSSSAAGPPPLAAASAVGATNIKVANRPTFAAGQTIKIDAGRTSSRPRSRRSAPSARGHAGTVTLTAPLTKAHASGGHALRADRDRPDRRHDEGLRGRLAGVERGQGLADRAAGTAARALGADRLRRHRDPLRRRAAAICTANSERKDRRAAGREPAATPATRRSSARSTSTRRSTAARRPSTTRDGVSPIVDPFGQPRLPGLRRHVREEHARRDGADAGDRRSRHVRLHLRRARLPRQLRQHPRRLRAWRGRLRPAAQGLRQGVRRLLHPPEERRDHEGQHALRRHRRGRRPLRRHGARRPVLRRRDDRVHLRQRPRHRGQRRPQAARRDVQREPRHERDDELQRPRGHGAERLHQRQSGPRLGRRRATSRRRCPTWR